MADVQKTEAATNPRGIPVAPFVDRVEDYVTSRADVESTLKNFQEMISKYQFMSQNIQRRHTSLSTKIPDISATLSTVHFLSTHSATSDPLSTTFELAETLHAHALVPPTEEVYLWLGANTMLAYSIPEARTLLEEKLEGAKKKMGECEEDLDFLREQITTLEVATARVYNWDVGMRRKEREEGEGKGG